MNGNDEISATAPRHRTDRDAGRMAALLLVGNGALLESLRAGQLVMLGDGADIGRRLPETTGRVSVVLADRTVSSVHARIDRLPDGSYVVEDCGSTNGTLLDGAPFAGQAPLREGSILFFGSYVALFRTLTAAERTAIESEAANPLAPVSTLSPALAVVCHKLRRLAPSATEVMLIGETGVGKEVFANALHAASGRSGRFVAINCAALPRELVETELFGYEQGAHSMAKARKEGLIAAAHGGTLFLDELGEMPLDVQSKLLRFLQDHTYLPIGSTRAMTADVRIVAASSVPPASNLPSIQDALLGRLGAQPVQIPPLREHVEDLGRLVAHFLTRAGAPRPLEPEAFQALILYGWPHNVRELEKVVTEAELLSRGEEHIGLDHLPGAVIEALERTGITEEVEGRPDASLPGTTRVRRPLPPASELRALMSQYHGNVTHVAKHLKRQWAVIWRSLRRHGIDPADFRGPGPGDPPAN